MSICGSSSRGAVQGIGREGDLRGNSAFRPSFYLKDALPKISYQGIESTLEGYGISRLALERICSYLGEGDIDSD